MKKLIITLACTLVGSIIFGQWTPTQKLKEREDNIPSLVRGYYKLDLIKIQDQLSNARETGPNIKPIELSLPTLSGKIEKFAVYSFPVVAKSLADQYQLGSYVGVGIDDPTKYVRFSVSPTDFQSIIFKDEGYEFIEPQDTGKTVYGVHSGIKSSAGKSFVCSTKEGYKAAHQMDQMYRQGKSFTNQPTDFAKISDKKYRTLRLVISTSGEYTSFHGGTVAGAMSAINATMTRVNGIFEKDFAVHLNVQNYPELIYTDAATDPYDDDLNLQLQKTLTANIGNANYDIGHLFNVGEHGGDAGGSICIDPDNNSDTSLGKGSGYSQDNTPIGDIFDMVVAHEMGHQLGAAHTFSHIIQGSGVNMEPGSGSTIMGYAGVTGSDNDVQPQPDAYFHIASIRQVQENLNNTTCAVEIPIANNPPAITPLPSYTIPKGTAFVLTASAIDEENDPLTYTWEQVDNANVTEINKNNLGITTSGASFRSVAPSASPTRYFPKLSSVLDGVLDNSNNGWESVSMVARTSTFAVTVRDNNPDPTQQQTQYAEQTIIVGNEGPFKINTLYGASNVPSTIEWDVANTAAAPYNVTHVKIDYTTDNAANWKILAASTPNDGTESVIFPSSLNGQSVTLKISALDNVFYAVKKVMIATFPSCGGSAPTGIVTNNITSNSINVGWLPFSGATSYVVRYKKISETNWQQNTVTGNIFTISNLEEDTAYELQVAAICSGITGAFSVSTNFTTLALIYCKQAGKRPDIYISNMTLANLNNTSGPSTYTDYGADPSKIINLVKGTANTISVSKIQQQGIYDSEVAIWIDFNRDGIFDTSERVMTSGLNQTPSTSATFTVPSTAILNKMLKMRVTLSAFGSAEPCGSFSRGEVEDYNVIITSTLGTSDIIKSNDGIQLHPNPVSEVLNITKVSDKATYKIYSASGQLVNSGNITDGQINVSGLIKGIYILTIEEKGKNSFSSKFINNAN